MKFRGEDRRDVDLDHRVRNRTRRKIDLIVRELVHPLQVLRNRKMQCIGERPFSQRHNVVADRDDRRAREGLQIVRHEQREFRVSRS
jgi:hypothetical protein